MRVRTHASVLACVFSPVRASGTAPWALEPGGGAGLSGFRTPTPGPWPEMLVGPGSRPQPCSVCAIW